jgi:hypothetical protein
VPVPSESVPENHSYVRVALLGATVPGSTVSVLPTCAVPAIDGFDTAMSPLATGPIALLVLTARS